MAILFRDYRDEKQLRLGKVKLMALPPRRHGTGFMVHWILEVQPDVNGQNAAHRAARAA